MTGSSAIIVDGLGGKSNGTPREDGYDITAASEIMAVLCLANDIDDLKSRLAKLVVGYTYGKSLGAEAGDCRRSPRGRRHVRSG